MRIVCGEPRPLDSVTQLVDNASYVSMDRFCIDTVLPIGERVNILVALCKKSCTERMLPSACLIEWLAVEVWQAAFQNWMFIHTPADVASVLRPCAPAGARLKRALVDNPRRGSQNVGGS